MESTNKSISYDNPLDETKTPNKTDSNHIGTTNSNQTESLNDNVFDTQTDDNVKSKVNIKDRIVEIKSKLQSIQITNIIFVVIIIILIIIIVVLVIYRPKIDTELLTNTQKLYEEAKIQNKELQNKIHKLDETNKTLMGINSNLMNENNSLKSQSNFRQTYTRVKTNVVKPDSTKTTSVPMNSTPKITEVPEDKTTFDINSNINSTQTKPVEDELNINDIINQ